MTAHDLIARARVLSAAATPGPLSINWISYALRLARKAGLDYYEVESDETLNSADESFAELFAASRDLVPALADALEVAERQRDDLAMLVRLMLAYPQSLNAREQAGNYLRQHNLNGSILRSDEHESE